MATPEKEMPRRTPGQWENNSTASIPQSGTERIRVREALQFIDPGDRDTWVRIGMAVKSELDEGGFDVWEAWSQTAQSFNSRDARDVWKSIRPGGKVTIGTLFHEAKAAGWHDNGTYQKPTPEELAERKRIAAKRDAKDKADIAREGADAAKKAAAIMEAATEANADHPYLACKHIRPVATLREIEAPDAETILGYAPKSGDDSLTGRLLVVPIKQRNRISSLELIDDNGRKTALTGRGSKAGGYWATERLPDGNGKGLTLLIGEGVATVLSAKEATGYGAIAALSSGNLLAVAKTMRKLYPAAALVILADLVKATGEPDPHATEAASVAGGLLAVPDFGPDRQEAETDFNDLHQKHRLEAVQCAIASAIESPMGEHQPDQGNAPAGDSDGWAEPQAAFDFPRVSIADIHSHPSPAPSFVWAGRVPMGHVTLLGAHGGAGKSMLALQLAVAVCLGADFLGASTEQGRVLFFSGEDAASLLRHRLGSIATHFGASPCMLSERLTILDATEEPALFRENVRFGVRTGETTPGFSRLAEIINEVRPALVIVDNASDVFEASENDRAMVRGFMRQLCRLSRYVDAQLAILLLAHIQKQAVGNRGVESYSGSTAWHNSARSRLALTTNNEDATRLILSHDKLNLGPRTAEPLCLVRSHTGLLMLDEGAPDAPDDAEPPVTALLRVLADFNRRDEKVSVEQSARNNAWKMLHPEQGFPKRVYRTAGALFAAIRQTERDGLITKAYYVSAHRRQYEQWRLTAKGWGVIGEVAPTASTAPTSGVSAVDAEPRWGAPTAPTSGPRGYGGGERTQVGAKPDVSTMAEKPTQHTEQDNQKANYEDF